MELELRQLTVSLSTAVVSRRAI